MPDGPRPAPRPPRVPPPSVPARLALLAWDGTAPQAGDPPGAHRLVRAGALAELARRGLLTDADGIATPADLDTRTGDVALDGLLDLVRESLPHRWRTWVRLHARVTHDAVREQLTAGGWLRAEKRRVLGVFPSVEHVPACPGVARALAEETRRDLDGPVPCGAVAERDAVVAVLAEAARLRVLGVPEDPAQRRRRVGGLTALGEASVPGLPGVLHGLREAVGSRETRRTAPADGPG
ncbi:GPP34 family phosphoprotein [Streptomyces sp. SCSIO 75703]|uniref:GOLPH3/VPS74 family protein n=1 Tax=unclassified Streptomyces TaxID=2593676 RepID=UPI0004BF981C|nr:GPP34 family phosphoprotein [Streptomyces sp. NRRL F-5065]